MGRNRQFVEQWKQVLLEILSSGDEYFTDSIPVGESTDDLGEPCAGIEWAANILFAATDNVNLRMYTSRKLTASASYVRSTEPKITKLLSCGGVASYNQCDKPAETDIGGAVAFSVQRTGAEADLAVTLWIRRYRYM